MPDSGSIPFPIVLWWVVYGICDIHLKTFRRSDSRTRLSTLNVATEFEIITKDIGAS